MRVRHSWVAWVLLGLSGAVCALDEREPNESEAMATELIITEIEGSIAPANDVDWIRVGALRGVQTKFTLTHSPAANLDFEVRSDKASIAKAVGPASGDNVTCTPQGVCYVRIWGARGTSSYRLSVTPLTTAVPPPAALKALPPSVTRPVIRPISPTLVVPPRGKTLLPLQICTEREPNKDYCDPTLSTCLTLRGTVNPANDWDWFVLDGLDGQPWTFSVTHDPAIKPYVAIHGAKYNWILLDHLQAPAATSLAVQVLGRCFVYVADSQGTGTGSYTITITPGGKPRGSPQLPTWEREPNDQQGQATVASDTSRELRGQIDRAGDVDWYSARTSGNKTSFYLKQDSTSSNFRFSIHDLNGKLLGEWQGETIAGYDLIGPPPRVLIRVWSVNQTTGPYRITIGFV